MTIRVLVEHTLVRSTAHLLRLARILEQVADRRRRLSASLTTSSSLPGSNHRSIPLYGFETIAAPHDASSNGRHEEDA